MGPDLAYLTVARWPEAWGPEQRAEALVQAAGVDRADANLRVLRGPPLVAARLDAAMAARAEEELHRRGVTTLVVTCSALSAMPRPARARRMSPAGPGRYTVEVWSGRTIELAMADVWLVVRAGFGRTRLGEVRAETQVVPRVGIGLGMWHVPLGSSVETSVTRERTIITRDVVELFIGDGRRVRVDGSKFNFDVLGAERGLSDKDNADRLALRLCTEATRAVVDTGFADFAGGSLVRPRDVPRSDVERSRFPEDDPVFEFYSVWAGMLYGRMLGRGESGVA